jgi:hypothetical protein
VQFQPFWGQSLVPLPRTMSAVKSGIADAGFFVVTWWTHKIRGLHRNDFIMAAKTEALAAESGSVTRDEIQSKRTS